MSAMRFVYVCTAFSCAALGIIDPRVSAAVTLNQPGYVMTPFVSMAARPSDIQVDGADNLYLSMGSSILTATANGVVGPWSAATAVELALIPGGGAYSAGSGLCNCIMKIDAGGSYSTLHQDAFGWTYVALGPDGTLYAVNWLGAGQGLYQIDRSTGQPSVVVAGGPGPGGIGFYRDIAFGLDGKLYALGNLDGTISGSRLFRLDGSQFTPVATPPHGGTELARGPSGVFYTTTGFDYGSGYPIGEVWIIDAASGATSLLASGEWYPFHFGFSQFEAIAYDPGTGRIYVGESTGQIWHITKDATPSRAESWGTLKARYRGERVAQPAP